MAKDLSVFADEVVDQVFVRDHGCCAKCGHQWDRYSGRGLLWSVHHRAARSMGGAKKSSTVGDVSNALIVCGHGTIGCHRDIETFKTDSFVNGFIVSVIGIRKPWEVPIKHAVHGWCKLTRDGGVEKCAPPEGEVE